MTRAEPGHGGQRRHRGKRDVDPEAGAVEQDVRADAGEQRRNGRTACDAWFHVIPPG